ncbi:MAG: hypothetical protein IKD04_08215 [Clostridia bacterium]|nr:hypothetical protein [Clostridia bacterium]
MRKRICALIISAILLLSSAFSVGAVSDTEYDYTVDLSSGKRVAISKCYTVEEIVSEFDGKAFGTVSDMFTDSDDNIYLLCKGENLIVKLDKNGNFVTSYDNKNGGGLKSPGGMFVDKDGDIFVADTGNYRIVHLSPNGAFEEEFTTPEGLELDDGERFSPSKLAISNSGYIYSMSYQNLMKVDVENTFRGYIGSTKVSLTFTQIIVNLFATQAQKKQLQKVEPEPYTNFIMGDDQYIYAVTLDYKNGQIKKLNAVGSNVFPVQDYGEPYYNKSGSSVQPIFTDISVNKDGVINVIEKNSCKIYQYDNEGTLLCVYGGYGTATGMLEVPTCIDELSDGTVLVYDEAKGLVFYKPTEFITAVHDALGYYKDCYYIEAMEYWQKALDICESYTLAHQGIGQAYYKMKEYDKAIEEYELGDLKSNYSQAFDKKRTNWLQDNFGWFFIAVLVFIIAAVYGVRAFKKLSVKCEYAYKGIRTGTQRKNRR